MAIVAAVLVFVGTAMLWAFQRDATDPGRDFAKTGVKTLGSSPAARFWNNSVLHRFGVQFMTRALPESEKRALTSSQEVLLHRTAWIILLTGCFLVVVVALG